MCPPSSGRNGKRLMTPRDRLIRARTKNASWVPNPIASFSAREPPTGPESCSRCSGRKIRPIAETVFDVISHIVSPA
jgi:hypothetical protein